MTPRLFVDTSAWFAFANRGDPDHGRVAQRLRAGGCRLVTTTFVFDETVTLCARRMTHAVAVRVGMVLRDPAAVDLVRPTVADEEQAWDLFQRRADKEYSYTDCTSFVLMRRLALETALALDEDFRREGFAVVP